MNIKRLCLIAGLLSLPVAYANASEITINVPIDIINLSGANRTIGVLCEVGVGALPNWGGASAIGHAGVVFVADKNFNGTKSIQIGANAGRNLDNATHYKCTLKLDRERELGIVEPTVRGPIPR